eukprot:CAMPEP_0179374022 /NCGR_PEP_ID=MMETSP0797-20121207/87091_1 /TAXON_ID=47934 /ORGANISM="Dinophysis acuminata, Strain DAEP01" /LENGTH=162 /DNA_ID=CAMNT_0021090021 /DNA_START=9 /DNA_END=498 /DNA_ORIENTATION=+
MTENANLQAIVTQANQETVPVSANLQRVEEERNAALQVYNAWHGALKDVHTRAALQVYNAWHGALKDVHTRLAYLQKSSRDAKRAFAAMRDAPHKLERSIEQAQEEVEFVLHYGPGEASPVSPALTPSPELVCRPTEIRQAARSETGMRYIAETQTGAGFIQ